MVNFKLVPIYIELPSLSILSDSGWDGVTQKLSERRPLLRMLACEALTLNIAVKYILASTCIIRKPFFERPKIQFKKKKFYMRRLLNGNFSFKVNVRFCFRIKPLPTCLLWLERITRNANCDPIKRAPWSSQLHFIQSISIIIWWLIITCYVESIASQKTITSAGIYFNMIAAIRFLNYPLS